MAIQLLTVMAGVRNDLSDTAGAVFTDMQIQEFVLAGMAELNRIAPAETKEVLNLQADPITGITDIYEWDLDFELIYRVEIQNIQSGWTDVVPEAVVGETVSTGWVFRRNVVGGGRLEMPKWWLKTVNANLYYIIVQGYRTRPEFRPDLGQTFFDYVELNNEDAYAVRMFARAEAYDLLAHDRSAFAQWQGQSNNTDVSPTQMMQMASSARDVWRRQRGLMRVVRRYW